ncbi:fibroblast growth factor 1 [Fopius arisanus]|uniref:Fibroblast growth factor 1 n=1 Tax=Fopius arisanus TaxID=64838 RepID=A0A9R1T4I6_9HYME|nr:PREDICTED: fibroblast growth factor 1-like [Fopius arisanus]
MSLRWIQENRVAPTCDEESSDIENSGTDDSYDTDLSINNDDSSGKRREKRNTTRHSTTTVTFDENGFVMLRKVLTLPDDQIALFNVSSVSFGVIRIQNSETGHFLAFNEKGHLYGEVKEHKDNTEWEQWSIGSYEAFRSHKFATKGWWIGIKKNGRPKAGLKTQWGQKAVQFLVIGHH